jgi:glutamine amidotransferase
VDAAADSALVRFVAERGQRSRTVMSHIRRATQGEVALRNTQPFSREVGGRVHLFAHNGDLAGVSDDTELVLDTDRPIGETDSEHAFCALMTRIRRLWGDGAKVPPIEARLETVADFAATVRELGPANFIYFDGDALFLHGHRRKHDGEEEPRPPGLHTLCRSCTVGGTAFEADGLTISGHNQHVVLAATVPLTDEPWEALAEGEIVVARRGEIVAGVGS